MSTSPESRPSPNKRRLLIVAGLAVLALAVTLALGRSREIAITGVVTTDDVIVSSEIAGRLQALKVDQGDAVRRGQLLAVIQPEEWRADLDYYENGERQAAAQVGEAEADLRYQEQSTSNQIDQAEANLAAAQAQVAESEADCENSRLTFERDDKLFAQGTISAQEYDQTRTAFDSAKARLEASRKQAVAAAAGLALAKANDEQNRARRAALAAGKGQLAAATAQAEKARVYLDYTEIRAPIDGVVDLRPARQGEVVMQGQAIVTLVNPDDLWVRADVEESAIERIHLGDQMTVRLPSGAERVGTVFYRGVDADYATQRDVSRTKRDIKTFEVRLRCDNKDRSLALGMTAYVLMPR